MLTRSWPRAKQVHLALGEPVDDLGLRQQPVVFVDVADGDADRRECLADEFAAVTLLRASLAAQQGRQELLQTARAVTDRVQRLALSHGQGRRSALGQWLARTHGPCIF